MMTVIFPSTGPELVDKLAELEKVTPFTENLLYLFSDFEMFLF